MRRRSARPSIAPAAHAAHGERRGQVEELSLSGNQPKKDMLARRRRFPAADAPHNATGAGGWRYAALFDDAPVAPGFVVRLAPLQIRTFLVRY